MNKDLNHHSIKQLLNQSSQQLPNSTKEKLRAAREHALQHQKTAQTAPEFAWIGQRSLGDGSHTQLRQRWASALLLIALLFSSLAYWHSCTTEHDFSDIDIAILTDEDLPLHAYDADEE